MFQVTCEGIIVKLLLTLNVLIFKNVQNSNCLNFAGFVIYRTRVRRGNRKKKVRKGKTMGKPVHQGVSQLKFARNLQSVAEVINFWLILPISCLYCYFMMSQLQLSIMTANSIH